MRLVSLTDYYFFDLCWGSTQRLVEEVLEDEDVHDGSVIYYSRMKMYTTRSLGKHRRTVCFATSLLLGLACACSKERKRGG